MKGKSFSEKVKFSRGSKRSARNSIKAIGLIFGATIVILSIMAALPAAAAQITVDGDGSDWIGLEGVRSITDQTHELWVTPPDCSPYQIDWDSGFDLADFAVYYNAPSDTIYFKFNLAGVPGDTDGDGNPNSCSYCSGTCSRASSDFDGIAATDSYKVKLDTTGDGIEDYRLIYTNNGVTLKDGDEIITYAGFILSGSFGSAPYTADNVVEMSLFPVHNLTDFEVGSDFTIVEARAAALDDFGTEDSLGPLPVFEAMPDVPSADMVTETPAVTISPTPVSPSTSPSAVATSPTPASPSTSPSTVATSPTPASPSTSPSVPGPTKKPLIPGFEVLSAFACLLAVAYAVLRRGNRG